MPAFRPLPAVVLAVALLPLAAQAGRPFSTEDAGVLARSACELEGVASRASASGAPSARSLGLQVGCGIGLRTQLALACGQARSNGLRADSFTLGGKTALAGHPDGPLQWTLAYALGTSKAPGGSHQFDGQVLNLVLSASPATGWAAHANLGLARSKLADTSVTTWGLAAERALGGGWDLGAELFGDTDNDPFVGLGLRWQASEAWSLNASLAKQAGSGGPRLASLGFKFSF